MAEFTMSQLHQALSTQLPEGTLSLPEADRRAFIEAAAMQLAAGAGPELDFERRIDDDLFNSNLAYAIPDDALKLFPSVVQAVIGAFAKGPVSALSELVGLLLRYRNLRIPITAQEAAVLRVLREAKIDKSAPLSLADIRQRIEKKKLVLEEPVGTLLIGLQAKNTDGATLVRETNGRWASGNV